MQKATEAARRVIPKSVRRATLDYALATWGNVFIVIWRRNTTAAAVQDLHLQCKRFGAIHPEGVLLLTIIREGAPAPDGSTRSALASFLKSADYIRGSAVIMEGTSFRAAFVRGVVTGLTMLAHQPFPHQVCSMEAAGQLFASAVAGTPLPFELESFQRGISELRATIEKDLADPSAKVGNVA